MFHCEGDCWIDSDSDTGTASRTLKDPLVRKESEMEGLPDIPARGYYQAERLVKQGYANFSPPPKKNCVDDKETCPSDQEQVTFVA